MKPALSKEEWVYRFTRADVDLVRACIHAVDVAWTEGYVDGNPSDDVERLESLADRIEALLPPETR